MVNGAKGLSRRAFTLIELIFAIVIISIAVISLPMMTQVNNRGIENSMVSEAIFAASTELMNASAGYWDANSMHDNNRSHLSRVIDIGSMCENNSSSPRHRLRPGHIAQPLHRRCLDSSTIVAVNEPNNIYPNLNNAVHTNRHMFLSTNPQASGYKDNYKSSLFVEQINDIKYMQIEVTNSKEEVVTILKMQSANVGEIDYYKRTL
ncbi:MAG: prepilin-type N-terminal cleavage/methylation domain-containing protein [Sulfurimonas sp.]|nr:prepilin-type N-terminal cleavage/methylation domain-containing protein [Sulfurimonas sp.]MDD3835149.1 prepilin-type N-terminal cleavage/methylation domain-containing protein [Sulfurimonas sp.]